MRPRVILMSLAALLLLVVACTAVSATTALHSLDVAGGELDLNCEARVTGYHEVRVAVWWTWTKMNPHPGLADEVVVLGPDGWCSMAEPGTKPPTSSAGEGEVQFGVVGDADSTVTDMAGADNVKAYAAIEPNEDGSLAVYLKTKIDPVAFEDRITVQYLMVERVPSPTARQTLADRLLRLLGVNRMKLFAFETQGQLSPLPDLVCPAYVGEPYRPSLTVDSPTPDLDKVARDLWTDYLEHHVASDQPDGQRLAEYVINNIKVYEEDATHFWFSVDYSVKPAVMSTTWIAGNGDQKFNGWIEGKYQEIDVVRNGDTFTVVGGGTGGHLVVPQ